MAKKKTDQLNRDSKNMLSEKTNEDFNKRKPDPKDPNEIIDHPIIDDNDEDSDFKPKTNKIIYSEEDHENDEK